MGWFKKNIEVLKGGKMVRKKYDEEDDEEYEENEEEDEEEQEEEQAGRINKPDKQKADRIRAVNGKEDVKYVAVPRCVTREDMFNIILDKLTSIEQKLNG